MPFFLSPKFLAITGLALVLFISLWCFCRWQPERQVELHQQHLLEAAQNRDWAKLQTLLDDQFHTPGGLDKTTSLQCLAEALKPFFTLKIVGTEKSLDVNNGTGKVRSLLRIEGNGLPLAQAVETMVNASNEPFEFTWKRASWKPWDWKLVCASHPLIGLAETQGPGLF